MPTLFAVVFPQVLFFHSISIVEITDGLFKGDAVLRQIRGRICGVPFDIHCPKKHDGTTLRRYDLGCGALNVYYPQFANRA